MSLPKKMRDAEKQRIDDSWQEFFSDALGRMQDKVDEGFLGWDNRVYEDTLVRRLVEKALKISTGSHTYKDCVDVANYAMMLGNFQKKREEELYED